MEFLAAIFGPAGGVVGFLGGLFTKFIEWKKEKELAEREIEAMKLKQQHELAMQDQERQTMKLEAESAAALAKITAWKETETAAYGALAAAHESDRRAYAEGGQSGWFILVDVARGLVRPMVTVYSVAALTGLAVWLYEPAFMDAETRRNTFAALINATVFIATSAVGYWFGTRQSGKV
jgi:hypothetical protein